MSETERIVFQTVGSRKVGFGHVRRCLSLAETLLDSDVESIFLVVGDAEVVEQITLAGFKAISLGIENDLEETISLSHQYQAQVIVVDSYTVQSDYFKGLSEAGLKVAAIDDLADRVLPVDLIVNGSMGAQDLTYRAESHTKMLVGPQYIVLRREFAENPKREISDKIERVLITVGGSDSDGLTLRLMHWVFQTLSSAVMDVVIGPFFEQLEIVERFALENRKTVTLHYNPPYMRNLMISADLAICGGGQTTYELAACGTPALAIQLADNQTINLKNLAENKALIWACDKQDKNLEVKIKKALADLDRNASHRADLSHWGRELIDGQGAIRVAQSLLGLNLNYDILL